MNNFQAKLDEVIAALNKRGYSLSYEKDDITYNIVISANDMPEMNLAISISKYEDLVKLLEIINIPTIGIEKDG